MRRGESLPHQFTALPSDPKSIRDAALARFETQVYWEHAPPNKRRVDAGQMA